MKNILIFNILMLFSIIGFAQDTSEDICETIGNDSLSLYNNGYIIGPQSDGSKPIHTESKWINVNGTDTLFIHTMQHRFYDNSKIYDENNQLIWTWGGESVPATTWYPRNHSLSISGNDSVRIEFYQGYPNFSVGHLQIVGISCGNSLNCSDTTITDVTTNYVVNKEFALESPKVYFISIDSLKTKSGDCDSIITRYVEYIFDANHCTDTTNIIVTDTNYVQVNNYVDVYDSLIVDLNGGVTAINTPLSSNLQVKIYPNPVSELLTLEVLDAQVTSNYTYELININGQILVANGSLNSKTTTIDLSFYSSGTYYIKFYDNQLNKVNQAPIVINK